MLVFAACGLSVRLFEGIDETRPPVSYSCVVGVAEPSQLLVDLAFVPRAGSGSVAKARANRIEIRMWASHFDAAVESRSGSRFIFAQGPQQPSRYHYGCLHCL